MNPNVRNLVALQDIELKISGLQKQINDIPVLVQAHQAELERLRVEHQQRVTHAQDLAKRRRTYEGDVDLLRSKLSKYRDQLMAVKTNKEYTAMLHEIQMAEEQIRSEEDKILEIMEEVESLEKLLKFEEKDLAVKSVSIQEEVRRLEASVPGLEVEAGVLREQSDALRGLVSAEMLALYHKLSPARRGMAMAEAKDELCTACHVRIRPQVFADLINTDNIHTCESCSRILFVRESL